MTANFAPNVPYILETHGGLSVGGPLPAALAPDAIAVLLLVRETGIRSRCIGTSPPIRMNKRDTLQNHAKSTHFKGYLSQFKPKTYVAPTYSKPSQEPRYDASSFGPSSSSPPRASGYPQSTINYPLALLRTQSNPIEPQKNNFMNQNSGQLGKQTVNPTPGSRPLTKPLWKTSLETLPMYQPAWALPLGASLGVGFCSLDFSTPALSTLNHGHSTAGHGNPTTTASNPPSPLVTISNR
jgi:hypothetical protein